MDLVVSSTLALDATHDVECYAAAASGRAQFCTSLLWSRKKAEAARARWPSDLQSRRWRTGSASHSSRQIHKARYRNGKSGAKIPIHASIGSPTPLNSSGRYRASKLRGSGSRSSIPPPRTTRWPCAIAKADLCLIPTRPSPADIEAAIPTLIAIRRLNRRFAFVLNQTPPRGCRLSETATSLNSLGVLALPYVGQRNDHQDALGAGLPAKPPDLVPRNAVRAKWPNDRCRRGHLRPAGRRNCARSSRPRPSYSGGRGPAG